MGRLKLGTVAVWDWTRWADSNGSGPPQSTLQMLLPTSTPMRQNAIYRILLPNQTAVKPKLTTHHRHLLLLPVFNSRQKLQLFSSNMPQELPGFYYDAEKNRYFPTKGPIPGTRHHPKNTPSHNECDGGRRRKTKTKMAKLIELRELNGNVISSGRGGSCNFEHEYQKELASQATIWKYKHVDLTASAGSLEQVHVDIQTSDGQNEADILLTGHMGIALNVYQVAQVDRHFDYGVEYMPELIWPSVTENQAIRKKAPQITWIPGGQINMSSTICSIKAMGNHCPLADDVGTPIQQALISTMGSATSGGSVHILKLNKMSDSNLRLRAFEVASFNCTIWASECRPDGSQAVIGTDKGAALVNIETGAVSWLCRTKSDVFSQQFNQLGNIILCGFRNGAILTVDVREKQRGLPSGIPKHRIPFSSNIGQVHSSRSSQKRTKLWFEVGGSIHPSCTIFMPSSISSLMSLKTDDQYFLASSMDGSIKLYDHRLIQKGPIQSYDGHVNSHTRIQLGVDPSERMMMSGGEDGKVRIWSIKTGELLFGTKISKSVPSSLCWPRTGTGPKGMPPSMHVNGDNLYHQNHSWGAWLGSADDLCYIHGS